jgi:CDP-diglyceride synthetase
MIQKEIIIGFLVALLATAFGFFVYVEFVLNYDFSEAIKTINKEDLWGKIIGLSALPNILVFFIFIKKKQDYRARGVLLETFVLAFFILLSMFI